MLIIRFSRTGKKNKAHFRVVLAEKSAPIKGRFIERLGSYDPHSKETSLEAERINHWIKQGAQVSDSVWNLLISQEVVKGEKRKRSLTPKKNKDEDEKKEGEKKEAEVKETKTKVEEKKEDKQEAEEKTKEEKPAEKENK